jgi:hypothetical protein
MDGPVIYYDDHGSVELPTTSTNLDDIRIAMNRLIVKGKGKAFPEIKSLKFVTG